MIKRVQIAVLLCCMLAFAVAFGAADDISRLYTFTSGTPISSSQVNGEFNQLITTSNAKAGRSVDNTFTGINTFTNSTNGIKIDKISEYTGGSGVSILGSTSKLLVDTINEYTASSGVTVAGVLHKTGYIKLLPTTQPYVPAANGEIGYDSTNHAYGVMVNSVARTLVHTGNLAAQADMETGTSTAKYVTPGNQQYHPGMPKAWGYVADGTVASPALGASYNTATFTRNSTGNYSVTFTTAMSSANYAVLVNGVKTTTTQAVIGGTSTQATTGFTFTFLSDTGTAVDAKNISFAVLGDE